MLPQLGAFGFLYYKDEKEEMEVDIVGNFGMKDQIAALKFIRDNIKNLGGDPYKITLAGQSAGAQSVVVHLTSEQDKDLFQQAILMSGPYSISLKPEEEALKLAKKFLKELRCKKSVLSCLYNSSAEDISTASNKCLPSISLIKAFYDLVHVFHNKVFHMAQPWGPTVGTQPISQFNKVEKPVIIGSLSGDGNAFAVPPLDFFPKILLHFLLPNYYATVYGKYQEWYKRGEILAEFLTEYLFTCPARYAALHMSYPTVYNYYFDHVLSFGDKLAPMWCHGHVCHGEDVPFFFQSASLMGFNFTKDEEKLLYIYSTYLANFVHHGDPNEISDNVHLELANLSPWLPINPYPENLWTMVFSTKEPIVSKLRIKKEQCEFWDGIGYYDVVRVNRK